MNKLFRVYIRPSCPHCQNAVQFLVTQGFNDQTEVVNIGFDPIISAGLTAYLGQTNIPTPVIVSFVGQGEVLVGNNIAELSRIIASHRKSGAVAPGAVVPEVPAEASHEVH